MIEVFSTSRQIRTFYDSYISKNTLLPRAITISEFETRAWQMEELMEADEDTRVLLMRRSAEFQNFKKLGIPYEFMAFLQNSDYLFNFFEELAGEEVDIDVLDVNDTYAEFSEHLSILKELLKQYSNTLLQNGLYDKITKPKIARPNSSYLKSIGEIRLHIEGYLSRFEIRLLNEAKQFCRIYIVAPINEYNKKMQDWLINEGIKTKQNTLIEFCLNDSKIIKEEILYKNNPQIYSERFSTRVLQGAFVFQKIEEFVTCGIAPENIAVVLPDESFASILKELDRFNNLNFAMGFGMNTSAYFERLSAVLSYFKNDDEEHFQRLLRLDLNEYQYLYQIGKTEELMDFLSSFAKEGDKEEESDIIKNELFLFEKFLQNVENITYEQAATLFLQRLKRKRTDDKNGGKITVMGVLESRGAKYDGVIIVDFNDDIVPKRSDKDMFISSNVRSRSHLPSIEDRENLQRFFYDRLIKNSKMTAASFVENENKMQSRFLKSFFSKEKNKSEKSYKDVILEPFDIVKNEQKTIVAKHDFFAKPLSSTRLAAYLECEKKYYFLHVKNYKESKNLRDENNAAAVGTFMHEVLRKLFEKKLTTFEHLKQDAKNLLQEMLQEQKNLDMEFKSGVWFLRLEKFFENEIKRLNEGWKIAESELSLERKFEGVNIVGKIDRIDKNGDSYKLIDYKTGSVDEEKTEKKALESSNFQLEFYSFLYDNPASAAFYDLKNGKLIEEEFLELKKEKLKEIIKELRNKKEFEFRETDDIKKCAYCPFFNLCGRLL